MNQIRHSGDETVINTARIFGNNACCLRPMSRNMKPELPGPQQINMFE